MGKRSRKGHPLHGWLVINKEKGPTSAGVVRKVKHLLKPQKIGHGGTLDPMATGVLPLGLGEATKTMPFLVDAEKTYEFVIAWGEETATDDAEGEVTGTSDVWPAAEGIDAVLAEFTGEIEQVPPQYSAVKVAGQRAYHVARMGGESQLEPRTVVIHSLERLEDDGLEANFTRFRMTCGKGTYVRSLARDLGRALGSFAHVAELMRTRVGPFSIDDSISLASLEELSHSARGSEAILPVMTVLADIPALAITAGEAKRIRQGQSLQLPTARTGTVCLKSGGELVAIGRVEQGLVRPLRVFQY